MVEHEELWVEVYGDYSVSNYGTVLNHTTNEEVVPFEIWNGEYKVRLITGGAYWEPYVSHLVAEAFFLNYTFDCQVGHINGLLDDNSVLNLTLAPSE